MSRLIRLKTRQALNGSSGEQLHRIRINLRRQTHVPVPHQFHRNPWSNIPIHQVRPKSFSQ